MPAGLRRVLSTLLSGVAMASLSFYADPLVWEYLRRHRADARRASPRSRPGAVLPPAPASAVEDDPAWSARAWPTS
jgi:hypothetical protein